MEKHTYIPKGVCARQIDFEIEDGKLHNVKFTGGCDGNTKAISKLLEGADAAHTVEVLKGNLVTRTVLSNSLLQLRHLTYLLTIEFGNHITLLQTCLFCSTCICNTTNINTRYGT